MPKIPIALPSLERLCEVLDYDPATGFFRWAISVSRKCRKGAVAGTTNGDGYRQIKVDGRVYRAARLAFKIINGRDPVAEIDHINCNHADDSADNLREATRRENSYNMPIKSHNKAGLKGIFWNKRTSNWKSVIVVNGRCHVLGHFSEKQAAHDAYCAAAKQFHGEFARLS